MAETRRAPSRIWYVLAGLLAVAAAAIAGLSLFVSIRQIHFMPVQLPGEVFIDVQAPGEWLVCIETTGDSMPAPTGMLIEFIETATGTTIPMGEPSWPLTYQLGDTRGVAAGGVSLPIAGQWTVRGTQLEGSVSGEDHWEYVVGPEPVSKVMLTMLIGGIITVILCSLAVGTWSLVFLLRWRNRSGA